MWRIPNPNPTESGTFSEIRRILKIRSRRIRNFCFGPTLTIVDVTAEVSLNNSTGTLIDGGLLWFRYFFENKQLLQLFTASSFATA